MHETDFSAASIPSPATILRLPMKDYSIGHEILLFRLHNPLVLYTDESFNELPAHEKYRALLEAVRICSRRKPNLFVWSFFNDLKNYCRGERLDRELKKFRMYRSEGSKDLPMAKMPRTPGAQFHYFGSPETARLLLFISAGELYRSIGYETPYDVPFGLARMLYTTQLECEGAVWVKNYFDYKLDERKAAFDRKYPESTLAIGDDAVQAAAEKWNAEHPDAQVPLPRPSKGSK